MANHKSKTIITIAFSTVIAIIIVLLVVWSNSLSDNQAYLEDIKKDHVEIYLLGSLVDQLNVKTNTAYVLSEEKDPEKNKIAAKKITLSNEKIQSLREKIDLLQRFDENISSWDKAQKQIDQYNTAIVEFIELSKVNHDEADDILIHYISPLHDNILENLQALLSIQKKSATEGVDAALDQNNSIYKMVFLLGTAAILLGFLNTFVIRQTGKTEAALLDQGTRIRKLYEITSKPGLNSEEQIREILKLGCNLLGMEIGKVCQIDKEANTNSFLNVYAPKGFQVCAGTVMPLDKTFCSITSCKEEPIALYDVSKSEYGEQFSHLAAYIATVITVRGKAWGTVNFSSNKVAPKPFTETDKDLLKLIGAWVSSSLERRFSQEALLIAKNDAEAASRTKSSFLASMSHELRTPLNAIIGYSELITEEANFNKHNMYDADLHKINSAALHLLALIDDILDLSKIEAGKMEYFLEDISIKSVVTEVQATVEPLMKKKNNVFKVNIENELGEIHADRLKLKQVMLNLLSNASKFTEEGEVVLNLRRETRNMSSSSYTEDWLVFSVIDTGIGISKEQISKIFQAFSQAEISTTSKFGGTGLGLAISRHICEMMGGDIIVKGAIGQGATFTVSLPCRAK